jgi:hypothetical protein
MNQFANSEKRPAALSLCVSRALALFSHLTVCCVIWGIRGGAAPPPDEKETKVIGLRATSLFLAASGDYQPRKLLHFYYVPARSFSRQQTNKRARATKISTPMMDSTELVYYFGKMYFIVLFKSISATPTLCSL